MCGRISEDGHDDKCLGVVSCHTFSWHSDPPPTAPAAAATVHIYRWKREWMREAENRNTRWNQEFHSFSTRTGPGTQRLEKEKEGKWWRPHVVSSWISTFRKSYWTLAIAAMANYLCQSSVVAFIGCYGHLSIDNCGLCGWPRRPLRRSREWKSPSPHKLKIDLLQHYRSTWSAPVISWSGEGGRKRRGCVIEMQTIGRARGGGFAQNVLMINW